MELHKGDLVLFEGDSITSRKMKPAYDDWPYLRLMYWDRTYADVVQEWLFCNRPDLHLKFRNSAVGGSAMSDVASRYEATVAALRPSWIILTTGHNDSAREVPLDVFAKQVEEYAFRAKALCHARVMIVGGLAPCPIPEIHKPSAHHLRSPEYYRVARAAVEKHGGAYVDVGQQLFAKAGELYRECDLHTIYSDGGHLNEVGNQIVATEVLVALGAMEIPGR